MNHEAKDLPYSQFEKIGLSKREVLSLPPDELKALLSERTTSLQTIKIRDGEVEQSMRVKLSIQRLPDGSLKLMVHPIRNELKNEDKLSNAQLENLKKGETVIAPKASMNGEKELYLFQLDQETNEIIKTRLNSISVPRYLMDKELTPQDKTDLLQGKAITLTDKEGLGHRVGIDLFDPKGYSVRESAIRKSLEVNTTVEREKDRTKGRKR